MISEGTNVILIILATQSLMLCLLFRYVSVLVELTRMEGTKHGQMIASQMLDVAIRVQAIQPFAVQQMVSIC
jgi:crotonobetainyl-CoA:carnitine CoA-transferase CaiB-like acyl-CoA transferase